MASKPGSKIKKVMWEAIQPNEQKINHWFQTGQPKGWNPGKAVGSRKTKGQI